MGSDLVPDRFKPFYVHVFVRRSTDWVTGTAFKRVFLWGRSHQWVQQILRDKHKPKEWKTRFYIREKELNWCPNCTWEYEVWPSAWTVKTLQHKLARSKYEKCKNCFWVIMKLWWDKVENGEKINGKHFWHSVRGGRHTECFKVTTGELVHWSNQSRRLTLDPASCCIKEQATLSTYFYYFKYKYLFQFRSLRTSSPTGAER